MIVYEKDGNVIRTKSVIMEDFDYIVNDWKTAMQTPKKII